MEKINKKGIFRITESELKQMVAESARKILSELDWKTYASAAQKNDAWKEEHPNHRANQWNRSFDFRNAARNAFDKKHGLEHQFDGTNGYGGSKGSINLNAMSGDFDVTGSRDHDFGDENPNGLNHNIYHMGKKYGKDGGYGRTRMWDYAHETTPEEFYGNDEMAKKFRDAEKDSEDFRSGKSHYVKGKGWENESKQSRKTIKELDENEKVLKEIGDTSNGQYAMGKLAARQQYRDKNSKGAFQTSWKAGDQQPNDRKGDNMNRAFHQGRADGQKQFMKEGVNNQNYSHFAVSKKSGKIMNGWDYSDYDPSELRQFKKDYFDVDMVDYGFNPKDFRILTYKYLVKNGIDPNDDSNWANNDEADVEFVG